MAILVASDVVWIVAYTTGTTLPGFTRLIQAGILLILALAVPRGSVPHLRGFVLALAAMVAGDWLMVQAQAHIAWFASAPAAPAMFARVFLTLIPAVLMGLSLLGSGLSRRDLYLRTGNLRAPAALPLFRGARWSGIAPILLVLISAGLLTQLWMVSAASSHQLRSGVLLMALPMAVVFAAINAGCEEFRFRCVLLARGTRCIGAGQSIAATCALFGVAHYFGHPSGLSGVLMAAFFAWIVARSMIDCHGWGWAWLLHFVQDVLIFLMVAMTGV